MEDLNIKKPKKWKLYIQLFLLLVIVGAGIYGYFWYTGVVKLQNTAQVNLEKMDILQQNSNKYEQIKKTVQSEYQRCQSFISQSEGDFGSFQYCQKYIQWVTDQKLL